MGVRTRWLSSWIFLARDNTILFRIKNDFELERWKKFFERVIFSNIFLVMILRSKAMQSSILSWTCQISDCSEHVTQCFQKSGFRDLIKKLIPIVINFNLRVEHSPVEPWRLGFLFVSSNQGKLSDLKSSMKSCTKKTILWNIPSSFDGLMGVVTCHFVRNHDLGSPPSLSLWEIRCFGRWLHDWWQGPIQTYSLDPFSAQTLPAPRPNSHPVVNQWCSMSISRKTGIFGNSFKKLGVHKTGIKKWQPKTGRHKNHGCFVPRPLAS